MPAPQECTLSGLNPGDIYQVQALAINDVGEGEKSDIVAMRAASVPATNSVVNTAPFETSCEGLSVTYAKPWRHGRRLRHSSRPLLSPE